MKYKATVTTYPTTANLGPLFDIAGARLDGRQSGLVMITEAHFKKEPGLVIQSTGKYPVPTHNGNEGNLAYKVASQIFKDKGLEGGLILSFSNNMKPGGLGTSGAGAIAVVESIDQIYELGLTDCQKIAYARLGEPGQHLDNVVPGILGGIVASSKYVKIKSPSNVIPSLIVPYTIEKDGGTAEARKLLEGLVANNSDLIKSADLAGQMVTGLIQDDFQLVRNSIVEYNKWVRC